MAFVLERLTNAKYHRLELYLLEPLYSTYYLLLKSAQETHAACGKYLLYSHRAVANNLVECGERTAAALRDFFDRSEEVQTRIVNASEEWKEAAPRLHDDLGNLFRRPWVYELLLKCLDSGCVSAQRSALCADLPSLQAAAEGNLAALGVAYRGLEDAIAQFYTTRNSTPGLEATNKLRSGAMSALIRLDQCFLDQYKDGMSIAHGGTKRWNPGRLGTPPLFVFDRRFSSFSPYIRSNEKWIATPF
ncbi:hypothetical protein B0H11DRAFT_1971732 [Mycena galericulata]|nr:hypothetical protein B0H11DRAFT_1971732 [Mycena galericulata]